MSRAIQITLIALVLVAQAIPGMGLQTRQGKSCAMDCCAWVVEAGLGDCNCEADPTKDNKSTPAPLFPTSSSRDLVPLAAWSELPCVLMFSPTEVDRTIWTAFDEQKRNVPHVRFSVLFCSFLI